MNKDKITAMCRKVSNETGLNFNSVMTYYFLESVLRKLSISKYNDKFIFKGGYILSNIVGLDSRSTVDIDFLFKNMPLTEELLVEIFDDILEYNEKDSIRYELKGIQEIKKQDEYGGYRIQILCKLDNIRQIVPLDIATGDILTYKPVDYESCIPEIYNEGGTTPNFSNRILCLSVISPRIRPWLGASNSSITSSSSSNPCNVHLSNRPASCIFFLT